MGCIGNQDDKKTRDLGLYYCTTIVERCKLYLKAAMAMGQNEKSVKQ